MQKSENRFDMVGKLTAVRKNQFGNTYIDLAVEQDGKILKPTVFVPRDVPLSVSIGSRVYISGYVLGTDAFDEKVNHSLHTQTYRAREIHPARPKKGKYLAEEFLNVTICGELLRILDSGHGWKKIVLKTAVEDGENSAIASNVSIGYYASDKKLIRVRDLKLGATYKVLVKPVTPERVRKDTGRPVIYQNLVAEYSREIA